MTERYELKLCSNGNYYLYHKGVLINAPYITFDKFNKEDAEFIISELNHLSNENEQLKKELKELNKKYIAFSEATDKRLKELFGDVE